jgi:predicted nucleic acid-binding protein
MRSAISLPGIEVVDRRVLFRALDVYEHERLHFAEAYLVALAETTGTNTIVSFDRRIDRVGTVERQEPA